MQRLTWAQGEHHVNMKTEIRVVMDWIVSSEKNSYAEALTANVTVLGNGPIRMQLGLDEPKI
jgi:hypothetical protein